MSYKITRTWTVVFVAVLALSLLLTACGNGGELTSTPTGDNTTPGVTDTQTPSGAETAMPELNPTPEEPTTTPPETTKPTKLDLPTMYNAEEKTRIDEKLTNHFSIVTGIDVQKCMEDVYSKYGSYLNENITVDAIKIGILTGEGTPYYKPRGGNLTGISPNALEKVNDFLKSNDEEPLDSTNPEQNIAALWLAASLYFDPDCENPYNWPYHYIAIPFGLSRADSSEDSAINEAGVFMSKYMDLFDLWDIWDAP